MSKGGRRSLRGLPQHAVNRLSNKASCYADNKLEEFDLTFCELASEDDPCPEDCRVELEKVRREGGSPGRCGPRCSGQLGAPAGGKLL